MHRDAFAQNEKKGARKGIGFVFDFSENPLA
jgi:hypothetical protein